MLLTAERLRALVTYDPETGVMVRRVANSNRVKIGDVIGTKTTDGYRKVFMDGKQRYVHRLAWLYVYGSMPRRQVDHINGDREDNRICNLRLATQAQQNGNLSVRSDSSSGHTGVSWCTQNRNWRAYITVSGKQIHLGNFSSKAAAISCRKAAAERFFGEYASHLCRRSVAYPSTQTESFSNEHHPSS